MGTELVGDFWLTLLIQPGARSSGPARQLLRMQILTQSRTGHLIALSEALPRRRIMECAPAGVLPRIYVRCSRCGCVAWLNDWMAGAELDHEHRIALIAKKKRANTPGRTDFLEKCTGTAYLEMLASALERIEEPR